MAEEPKKLTIVYEFEEDEVITTYTKEYGGLDLSWSDVMGLFKDGFVTDSNLEGLYGEADEIEDGVYRFCVYNKDDNYLVNIYPSANLGIPFGERLDDEYDFEEIQAWKYNRPITEEELLQVLKHIDSIITYKNR